MLQIPYPQNFILQKKGRKKQHSSLMGYFDLRKVCMLRYKRSKVQKASSIMFPTKCHFYITCNLVADVASFKLKLAAQDPLIIPCILFTLRIQSFFPLLPQQQVESLPVAKQQAASKGGEDNDEDEEDAGVNSTWVVPSRSSFPPCRAKKGPCSHACSVKRGQGELRCAMRARIAILCRFAPLFLSAKECAH